MTIGQHLTEFSGLPVKHYDPDDKKKPRKPCVYRLGGLEYGEAKHAFPELLDRFLMDHGGKGLTALVVGAWKFEDMCQGASDAGRGASGVVDALVANRDKMPNLRALFFGDITYEECEISWLQHGNISALLPAFPRSMNSASAASAA